MRHPFQLVLKHIGESGSEDKDFAEIKRKIYSTVSYNYHEPRFSGLRCLKIDPTKHFASAKTILNVHKSKQLLSSKTTVHVHYKSIVKRLRSNSAISRMLTIYSKLH